MNIQESPAGGSDIAFHFDVRFNCGNNNINEVVRNSMSGNSWGSEERHKPFFPFRPQANFDLMILCDAHVFKVRSSLCQSFSPYAVTKTEISQSKIIFVYRHSVTKTEIMQSYKSFLCYIVTNFSFKFR